MSPASGSVTIRIPSAPDNLSSTNAHADEPLYGPEPDTEPEPEQVPARQNALVKKNTWKWSSFVHKFPLYDLFKHSRSSTRSGPIRDVIHEPQALSLIPGILRLPVEIRNEIYGYIFDKRLITIRHNDDSPYRNGNPLIDAIAEHREQEPERPKAIKSIRIVMSVLKTSGGIYRKVLNSSGASYHGIPGRKPQPIEGVNWQTSLSSLLLTCKTFYFETAPILYGITTFYFDDAQRLRAFLETVSERNLACITTLHVHVRTYGIPNEAQNNRWEQKHVKCWTKIFANIAKKMTNLRVMRVYLTVKNVTDALKLAFRSLNNNTDWKRRASYMLVLRGLSDLTKLEDLRVSIKATDDIMQDWEYMSARYLYDFFLLANIHPLNHLQDQLRALHNELYERMHGGLEKAMTDVARSKDPDESFAPVAQATEEYIAYCMDPVGDMLVRRHPRE